ncbi:lactate utilization protein C [Denitrificimonas sp. JX-1]|uniref:Lactate utilization protein C n=1 Tax=Denitrificimonas halotolerans TaxID=3098930 RepID=A0ABU5GME2_9GAMM|nr:lactate utilization protein C [Denitrificimonas sp. JX-1]MDY7218092.1 lactate utilization protein C [Denitrificimonas sp. JX-1]
MSARDKILASLRSSLAGTTPIPDPFDAALVDDPWRYKATERVTRLKELMGAVHSEVHLTTEADWPKLLHDLLNQRKINKLLVAPSTHHGQAFSTYCQTHSTDLQLLAYERPIEEWKRELFDEVPASLTGTLAGIAATGTLVVQPSPAEPRLMSLVPPLHIALLKASQIHDNLYQAQQHWPKPMPSNLLLISGPSKTADIEQVLAYGAHGPKDLIVLIMEDA